MNFLKNLFGGGGASNNQDNNAYYVYVRPKMCKEIIEIRINTANDLSRTDDYEGFWVRKVASATRCPFQAELTLYFDSKRRFQNSEITNGEYVSEEEYRAFIGENEM